MTTPPIGAAGPPLGGGGTVGGAAGGHPHTWQLRSVDHDDGMVCSCFECDQCDAVWFT